MKRAAPKRAAARARRGAAPRPGRATGAKASARTKRPAPDADVASLAAWLRGAGVWWDETALRFAASPLHGLGVFHLYHLRSSTFNYFRTAYVLFFGVFFKCQGHLSYLIWVITSSNDNRSSRGGASGGASCSPRCRARRASGRGPALLRLYLCAINGLNINNFIYISVLFFLSLSFLFLLLLSAPMPRASGPAGCGGGWGSSWPRASWTTSSRSWSRS